MAREYAPQAPTREYATEAKPSERELSFPEKAEGFVYGLGTSIPGMLGDIESVLPGGPEVGVKGRGALAGKETVFPTTENVREALTKMGLPPPPGKDVQKYITYGELAPLVLGGGKALYEGGKSAVQAAKLFGEKMSLGKTAKELAEQLRTSGVKTAGGVAKKAGEEMTAAEQRAAIAGKAEQKAVTSVRAVILPLLSIDKILVAPYLIYSTPLTSLIVKLVVCKVCAEGAELYKPVDASI